MEPLKQWIKRITQGASQRAVARKSGIRTATYNTQWNDNAISPENVVAIARAYGQDPLLGLIHQGLLTEEEINSVGASTLTDEELVQEIWRRLQNVPEGESPFDQPMSEPTDTTDLRLVASDLEEGPEEYPHG